MAKKGRKKTTGEKKVPRVQQLKGNEKRSRRNSWMTSLITIGVIILLSVFWYITSNNDDGRFVSEFDAFSCELPDSWTTYNLEDTIRFEGWLGNCSHPHLFAPKSVLINDDPTQQKDTLNISPELMEAIENSQGKAATPESAEINRQIAEQLKATSNVDAEAPEVDLNLTVLTAAIFGDDKSDADISTYVGGIGGIDEPIDFYLNRLELEGTKIPGAEYGYYKILAGHPTGIIKSPKFVIIFSGQCAENRQEDIKSIFESIEIP